MSDTSTTTELKAALYNLIVAARNFEREDRSLSADEDMLTKAIKRLQDLEEKYAMQERTIEALQLYVTASHQFLQAFNAQQEHAYNLAIQSLAETESAYNVIGYGRSIQYLQQQRDTSSS